MWRGVGIRAYLTPLCPVELGIVWIRDTKAQYVSLCPMLRVSPFNRRLLQWVFLRLCLARIADVPLILQLSAAC